MNLRIPIEYLFMLLSFSIALAMPELFRNFYGRPILFGTLVGAFGALSVVRPRAAILSLFVFLTLMGDLRRYVGTVFGFSGTDPLLLVGPVTTLLMMIALLVNKAIRLDTKLSRAVAGMMGFMLLQMFNPLQGGIAVGLGGAMFYVIPLCWFWLGKRYATPELVNFVALRVVLPLSVLAAALAMYQLLFGFLPFELAWIKTYAYGSLYASATTIKPVSFFTNAIEYVRYLCLGMAFIAACWFRKIYLPILLLPLLFTAMFLESSRGPVVLTLFVFAMLWAAQGRSRITWVPRFALALALGSAGMAYGLTELNDASLSAQTSDLVQHQTQGLLNPLDERHSTATTHFAMIEVGIESGLRNPVGKGIGSTTLAGSRFGHESGSSEVDFSDMFMGLGVVGGVLYLWMAYLILKQAFELWQRTRQLHALIILGALLSCPGSWLLFGEYAKNPILWFLIGALDIMHKQTLSQANAPRARLA